MDSIDTLIDGYRRFRQSGYDDQRARWAELAAGQAPKTMVIACSDSRVDPATVFDVAPGELFVVRNVANLVPPCEMGGGRHGVSAALEFAVTQLEVENILVLGHGSCGGVHAALTQRFADAHPGEGGFIAHWIDLLDTARDRVLATNPANPAMALEHEAVRVSLTNLRSFDAVREREARGTLRLHGAWFAIATGQLYWLDRATDTFKIPD